MQRLSRPLPVEYLLVDVPATTPLTPTYTFTVRGDRRAFPVENRPLDGHLQDFHALSSYLSQWNGQEFPEAMSDFHLLVYLSRMDMLPIKPALPELLSGLRTKDTDVINQWRTQEVWRTLETLIAAGSGMDATGEPRASGSSSSGLEGGREEWTCNHCTYINQGDMQSCDMCSLPR